MAQLGAAVRRQQPDGRSLILLRRANVVDVVARLSPFFSTRSTRRASARLGELSAARSLGARLKNTAAPIDGAANCVDDPSTPAAEHRAASGGEEQLSALPVAQPLVCVCGFSESSRRMQTPINVQFN